MALTQADKDEMYQYLLSRGSSVATLPEGSSNLSDKYLAPVFEYAAGGSAGRLVRLAVSFLKGEPGKSISLQKAGGYIQYKQGDGDWTNLVPLSEITGPQGDSVVLRKGATAIEWKKSTEADALYKTLVALADLKGATGDSIMLRKTATAIEWKKFTEADTAYKLLVSLADIKGGTGNPGKNPVFRKGVSAIEYKLDGEADTAYKLLVALSDIKGNTGDSIALRKTATALEWKKNSEADSTYKTLVPLADIKGGKGDTGVPGKNFTIEGYYNTLTLLQAAVPSPVSGATYGVGTAAPYRLYIYDTIQKRWVDNGMVGQSGAGTGNVYVDASALLAGKKYLFTPSTNGSATGMYTEFKLDDFAPVGYEFLYVKKV